jgi:nucleoside phosphorylase
MRTAFVPDLLLMVGMCMGMPSRRLKVGTVLVPNEVVLFDHRRLRPGRTLYRPHGDRVDNPLYRVARLLASEGSFEYPVIADKGLATSSVKIEDARAGLLKAIERHGPDLVAFDMEGWGFYRAGEGAPALWVKAVADSAETQGDSAAARDAKQSNQSRVTTNAIDFALHVIRQYRKASPVSTIV